jgi:hypothetical protein
MRCVREQAGKGLSLVEFKKLFRDQFFMLILDERRAMETIPDLLAEDPDLASRMADNLHRIIDVVGLRTSLAKTRLAEVDDLIEAGKQPVRPDREHPTTRSKHH